MKARLTSIVLVCSILLCGLYGNLYASNASNYSYQAALSTLQRLVQSGTEAAKELPQASAHQLAPASSHHRLQAELTALEIEEEEELRAGSKNTLQHSGTGEFGATPYAFRDCLFTGKVSFPQIFFGYIPVSRCIAFQVFRL